MERINIKDFKAVSRFTIIQGVFKKAAKALEGKELEFYNLDKDAMDKITNEENIDKKNNEDFLFEMIPILSNVDMTIDREEFNKMCKFPSLEFANYIDLLMEHIKEMFKTAITLNSTESKTKGFMAENGIEIPEDIPVVEPVKSKEEIIEELYKEIEGCTDRVKIKETMAKINELEKETVVDVKEVEIIG